MHAVEKNPVSFGYLVENLRRNGVADRAIAYRSDNREAEIPAGGADRVVLGYLPSAVPWVERALGLLRPSGGTLHVHLLVGSREGSPAAIAKVRAAVESGGGRVTSATAHEVKPYGPGRSHVVVDVGALPVDRPDLGRRDRWPGRRPQRLDGGRERLRRIGRCPTAGSRRRPG